VPLSAVKEDHARMAFRGANRGEPAQPDDGAAVFASVIEAWRSLSPDVQAVLWPALRPKV
jgi:hypothetical protein